MEPGVQGTRQRTDLLISEPGASQGVSTYYDLSIRAPTSAKPVMRVIRTPHTPNMSALEIAGSLLKGVLDNLGAHKTHLYQHRVVPINSEPLTLSLRGNLSRKAQLIFGHWSRTSPRFERVMEPISICFLRIRTQHCELGVPLRPDPPNSRSPRIVRPLPSRYTHQWHSTQSAPQHPSHYESSVS